MVKEKHVFFKKVNSLFLKVLGTSRMLDTDLRGGNSIFAFGVDMILSNGNLPGSLLLL